MIKHLYGNNKIFVLKSFKKIIEFSIRFFLSLFYNFKSYQKIIISTAIYAPWIEDKKFFNLFSSLKDLTILDEARAYTLWYLSKSLKNTDGDILDIGCMKGGAGIIDIRNYGDAISTTSGKHKWENQNENQNEK